MVVSRRVIKKAFFTRLILPLKLLRTGCRQVMPKQGDLLGGCYNNPVRDDDGLNQEIMMGRMRSG